MNPVEFEHLYCKVQILLMPKLICFLLSIEYLHTFIISKQINEANLQWLSWFCVISSQIFNLCELPNETYYHPLKICTIKTYGMPNATITLI